MFTDTQKKSLFRMKSYQDLPRLARHLVKLHLMSGLSLEDSATILELPNPSRTIQSAKLQTVLEEYGTALSAEVDYIAALEDLGGTVIKNETESPVANKGTYGRTDAPQSILSTASPSVTPQHHRQAQKPSEAKSDSCADCGAPGDSFLGGVPLCPSCFRARLHILEPRPYQPPVSAWAPEQERPAAAATGGVNDGRCPRCQCVLCCCGTGRERAPNEIVLGGDGGCDVMKLFPGITPENTAAWRDQQWDEEAKIDAILLELASRERDHF